jgi:hypothetical protein
MCHQFLVASCTFDRKAATYWAKSVDFSEMNQVWYEPRLHQAVFMFVCSRASIHVSLKVTRDKDVDVREKAEVWCHSAGRSM